MSFRELKTLAVLTFVVLALTVATLNFQSGGKDREYLGMLWLEELDLNAVTRIEVAGPGNQTQVTVERRPEGWGVEQRDHYPAQVGIIRSLLLELSEAKRLERKTSDPDQQAQLGLGSIEAAGARGKQVTLLTGDGALTLRIGISPSGRKATYVRTGGDDQSWLVDRTFRIPPEPKRWLAPELVDIGMDQIIRMQVEHPDGERIEGQRAAGGDVRFDVINLPEGAQPKNEFVLNRMASAITTLSLEDVMPATHAKSHWGEAILAQYDLAQGYTLKARLFSVGDDRYVHFEAVLGAGMSSEHRAQARSLSTRLKDWAFRVPSFAYDSMALRWLDILAEPPQDGKGE